MVEVQKPEFVVKRLKGPLEIVEHWPLFQAGLDKLNGLTKDRAVPPATFLRLLTDYAARPKNRSHICLYGTKQKPLIGFTVSFENLSPYRCPTAIIYAAFFSEHVPGLISYAYNHIEKWAKSSGYEELETFSPRINGKGFAMFEKRFGFKRWLVHFVKKI